MASQRLKLFSCAIPRRRSRVTRPIRPAARELQRDHAADPPGRLIDNPQQGNVVNRTADQAQIGEGIFDLFPIVKALSSYQPVGYVEAPQLFFEDPGLKVGAIQHSDLALRLTQQIEDPPGHETGLDPRICGNKEGNQIPPLTLCPKFLGSTIGVAGDHRAGSIEDDLC